MGAGPSQRSDARGAKAKACRMICDGASPRDGDDLRVGRVGAYESRLPAILCRDGRKGMERLPCEHPRSGGRQAAFTRISAINTSENTPASLGQTRCSTGPRESSRRCDHLALPDRKRPGGQRADWVVVTATSAKGGTMVASGHIGPRRERRLAGQTPLCSTWASACEGVLVELGVSRRGACCPSRAFFCRTQVMDGSKILIFVGSKRDADTLTREHLRQPPHSSTRVSVVLDAISVTAQHAHGLAPQLSRHLPRCAARVGRRSRAARAPLRRRSRAGGVRRSGAAPAPLGRCWGDRRGSGASPAPLGQRLKHTHTHTQHKEGADGICVRCGGKNRYESRGRESPSEMARRRGPRRRAFSVGTRRGGSNERAEADHSVVSTAKTRHVKLQS